jgi:hypothetical protein
MKPGVVLEHDLCPETPDPREQKVYCSFVAKLHFGPCFHCFTASKILRISRTNAMGSSAPRDGILGGKPQLQADVPPGGATGLDGFAHSDWGNSDFRLSTTGLMALFNETIVLWR